MLFIKDAQDIPSPTYSNGVHMKTKWKK